MSTFSSLSFPKLSGRNLRLSSDMSSSLTSRSVDSFEFIGLKFIRASLPIAYKKSSLVSISIGSAILSMPQMLTVLDLIFFGGCCKFICFPSMVNSSETSTFAGYCICPISRENVNQLMLYSSAFLRSSINFVPVYVSSGVFKKRLEI